MKIKRFMAHAAMAASLAFSASSHADIKVVVHADNPIKLEQSDIQRIYLGKTRQFPSTNVEILTLSNKKMFSVFNDKVLNKTNAQYKAYWSKLLFTGKATPPDELDDDGETLATIAQNTNAIGFIDGEPAGPVRVIATF
jgi:ABC-type phosphate transport system substrate-binding protein